MNEKVRDIGSAEQCSIKEVYMRDNDFAFALTVLSCKVLRRGHTIAS